MGKYKDIREVLADLMADQEWHTIEEIEKKCEEKGITLGGKRNSIYGVIHQLKKKGEVETSGTGQYKICIDKMSGTDNKVAELEVEYNNEEEELEKSIKKIEAYLERYRKFNWINCSEEELQKARTRMKKLIKLYEKIKNEFNME